MNMKKWKNNTKIFSITKKVKMKKIYCIICGKYKKFLNPKISYIFDKTLFLSIIYSKCGIEDKKILKEEESVETLKSRTLIKNIWLF